MNQTIDLTELLEQIKAGAKIDGKDRVLAPLIKTTYRSCTSSRI